jgi:hypothetical protein
VGRDNFRRPIQVRVTEPSREFASADTAAGAQDAAVQEPRLSAEIPINSCRRIQYL